MRDLDATFIPVDRQAATVVSPGTHFEPNPKYLNAHGSQTCPVLATGPLPRDYYNGGKRRENLTGRVFGRLTVVGWIRSKKDGVRWIARCACGWYERFRAKMLDQNMCSRCRYLEDRKAGRGPWSNTPKGTRHVR